MKLSEVLPGSNARQEYRDIKGDKPFLKIETQEQFN
jgi:hypothetical protein